MNIFEKMSAITNELTAVAKNLSVGEGKNSYKAVGEADVLAAVKPLEAKFKVYSYPYSRDIVADDMFTTAKTYNGQTTETTKFFLRVHTVYRFVDMEKPEDYIEVDTYGDGIDTGDKAPGKAMTYGDKYALLKAYKIITGDDPDVEHSPEDEKVTRSNKQSKAKTETASKPAAAQNVEPNSKINGVMAQAFHDKCAGDEVLEKKLLLNLGIETWLDLTMKKASALNLHWDECVAKARG